MFSVLEVCCLLNQESMKNAASPHASPKTDSQVAQYVDMERESTPILPVRAIGTTAVLLPTQFCRHFLTPRIAPSKKDRHQAKVVELSSIREELQVLIEPLLQNAVKDNPYDLTLYCSRYFLDLLDKKDQSQFFGKSREIDESEQLDALKRKQLNSVETVNDKEADVLVNNNASLKSSIQICDVKCDNWSTPISDGKEKLMMDSNTGISNRLRKILKNRENNEQLQEVKQDTERYDLHNKASKAKLNENQIENEFIHDSQNIGKVPTIFLSKDLNHLSKTVKLHESSEKQETDVPQVGNLKKMVFKLEKDFRMAQSNFNKKLKDLKTIAQTSKYFQQTQAKKKTQSDLVTLGKSSDVLLSNYAEQDDDCMTLLTNNSFCAERIKSESKVEDNLRLKNTKQNLDKLKIENTNEKEQNDDLANDIISLQSQESNFSENCCNFVKSKEVELGLTHVKETDDRIIENHLTEEADNTSSKLALLFSRPEISNIQNTGDILIKSNQDGQLLKKANQTDGKSLDENLIVEKQKGVSDFCFSSPEKVKAHNISNCNISMHFKQEDKMLINLKQNDSNALQNKPKKERKEIDFGLGMTSCQSQKRDIESNCYPSVKNKQEEHKLKNDDCITTLKKCIDEEKNLLLDIPYKPNESEAKDNCVTFIETKDEDSKPKNINITDACSIKKNSSQEQNCLSEEFDFPFQSQMLNSIDNCRPLKIEEEEHRKQLPGLLFDNEDKTKIQKEFKPSACQNPIGGRFPTWKQSSLIGITPPLQIQADHSHMGEAGDVPNFFRSQCSIATETDRLHNTDYSGRSISCTGTQTNFQTRNNISAYKKVYFQERGTKSISNSHRKIVHTTMNAPKTGNLPLSESNISNREVFVQNDKIFRKSEVVSKNASSENDKCQKTPISSSIQSISRLNPEAPSFSPRSRNLITEEGSELKSSFPFTVDQGSPSNKRTVNSLPDNDGKISVSSNIGFQSGSEKNSKGKYLHPAKRVLNFAKECQRNSTGKIVTKDIKKLPISSPQLPNIPANNNLPMSPKGRNEVTVTDNSKEPNLISACGDFVASELIPVNTASNNLSTISSAANVAGSDLADVAISVAESGTPMGNIKSENPISEDDMVINFACLTGSDTSENCSDMSLEEFSEEDIE